MAKKGFDIESINMDELMRDSQSETEYDMDMDIEDLEPRAAKATTHRKERKNPLVILFACTTILAVIGCLVLLFENWRVTNDYEKEIEASAGVVSLTQEELDAYSRMAEDAVNEATNEMRADIKETVENESVLTMLRDLYPEYIVLLVDGKYNFIPIDESLERHNLVAENIVTDENGTISYYEDGQLMSHKGIDVSRFQGEINWQKVAEDDVVFAFVRLGIRAYGTGETFIDENYEANMAGALNAGLDVGVYFFSQAITTEEALEEANMVIENLDSYRIKLPVVLDVEYMDGDGRADSLTVEERTQIALTFCEAIEEAGYEAMIYGNTRSLLVMLDMAQLREYSTWFAYYNTPIYYPYKFTIWQYSETGKVDGIVGNVDLNLIIGDYPW